MKSLSFRNYLNKQLKNPEVKKAFDAEDVQARLALMLAETREKQHLTQVQLAKKLHVPQQTISKIERLEHTNLTISTLEKFAKAFGKELVVTMR